MTAGELIVAIIVFMLAALQLFLAARSFMGKGFLLNNAYIYATEEEREKMDKKPFYRQTAIVFTFLGTAFVVIGLSLVLKSNKILLIEIPLIAGAAVYAIVSTAKLFKQMKK